LAEEKSELSPLESITSVKRVIEEEKTKTAKEMTVDDKIFLSKDRSCSKYATLNPPHYCNQTIRKTEDNPPAMMSVIRWEFNKVKKTVLDNEKNIQSFKTRQHCMDKIQKEILERLKDLEKNDGKNGLYTSIIKKMNIIEGQMQLLGKRN